MHRRLLCGVFVAVVVWGQQLAGGRAAGQESVELYRDAANLQKNRAYDVAIEEWHRFLKDFPDHELATSARFNVGICYLQVKKYGSAIDMLKRLIAEEKDKDFPQLEDALWNLSVAQFALGQQDQREMYQQAVDTYVRLLAKFPKEKAKYHDLALFYRGEGLYALDKKQEAAQAYSMLVDQHPKSQMRADGLYAAGVTYEELGDYPAAGLFYETYLTEFPDGEVAIEVRMRQAEMMLQAGKYTEAAKQFAEAAAEDKFAAADHALIRQAYCLWKLDRFSEAGDVYARVADWKDSAYAAQGSLSAGRSYYRARRYEDAEVRLRKILDSGADTAPEAAHWICRIFLQRNEAAQAVKLAEKMLPAAKGGPYQVRLEMDRADATFAIPKRRAESLELYQAIAESHSQHKLVAEALYNVAYVALNLARYDDGLAHATRFLDLHSEHALAPDVKYVAAECHLLLNQFDKAEQLYSDLTDNHPDHDQWKYWHIRLATALFVQRRYEDTRSALEGVVAKLNDKVQLAEARFLLGSSYFHESQYGPAADSLEASLAADTTWVKADEGLLTLSRAYDKLQRNEDSLEAVKRLVDEYPDSGLLDQAYYHYGRYCHAAGDFPKAAGLYAAVMEKWPRSTYVPHALSGQGWSQYRGKDIAAAVQAFTRLIDDYADHALIPDARYARALCRRSLNDFQGAAEDLNEYLKTEPSGERLPHARFQRGLVLMEMDSQAAMVDFHAILTDHPKYKDSDRVKYQLAWAYKMGDKAKESLEWFSRLTADHPDSVHAAEAYYHQAEDRYWQQKDFSGALEFYGLSREKAVVPEMTEKSTYMIGWTEFQLKHYETAVEHFRQQVKSFPEGPHFADGLFMNAECLFYLKKYKNALAVYTKARDVNGLADDRMALVFLRAGQCAGQLKSWKTSLQWLQQVSKRFPDWPRASEALLEQGVAHFAIGRRRIKEVKNPPPELATALDLFDRAARKSRGGVGASARFHAGEVEFQRKNFREAIKHYQRVRFGYGGEQASSEVRPWQARAAFQAGQAKLILAGENDNKVDRQKLIVEGKEFLKYVVEKHPQSDLAVVASKRLKKL